MNYSLRLSGTPIIESESEFIEGFAILTKEFTFKQVDKRILVINSKLTPRDVVDYARHCDAILLAQGSITSHGVIMAVAYGIPVVFGIGAELRKVESGCKVKIFIQTGEIVISW